MTVAAVLPWFIALASASAVAAGSARSLVEAEHAFARIAATAGTRAAFLAVLDDSGVVFRPTAVNGRAVWTAQSPRPGVLAWEPEFAEVAAAGDLGFTTGPWSFRPSAADTPVAYGHYVSIWRRTPPGPWRLLADLGVSHERPTTLTPTPVLRSHSRDDAAHPASALAALFERDRAVARLTGGFRADSLGAAGLRVLREGAPPRSAANVAHLVIPDGGTRVEPRAGEVARSGDLAFTRGLGFTDSHGNGGPPADTVSYVRIWRREGDSWRIALDIEVPTR